MKLKVKKGKKFITYLILKKSEIVSPPYILWVVDAPKGKFKYLNNMPELSARQLLISQGYQLYNKYS